VTLERLRITIKNEVFSISVIFRVKIKYGFRLVKNMDFMDFYLNDETSSELWFNFIKKYAVLKSFNSEY